MAKPVRKLAIGMCAGLVTLALLEAGVRLLLPRYTPDNAVRFVHDPQSGVIVGPPNTALRQRKNTGDYDIPVQFNQHGLRDARDIADATANDWVVVGDSFSFGWGVAVKERFSNRLEKATGHRVFNLAAPGDLDNYADLIRYAESKGGVLQKIIIGLCMENDVLNYAARDAAGATPAVTQASVVTRAKRFLGARLAMFSAVTGVVHGTPWLRRLAIIAGMVEPAEVPPGVQGIDSDVVDSVIARINMLANDRQVIVLMIPSRGLWVGEHRAKTRALHELIRQRLADAGMTVVDPVAEFEQGLPLEKHFRFDGHWNARGHATAGDLLARGI